MPRNERVLYIVRTWVPEDQLEEWDRWHKEVHVPDAASQPQVLNARRFRVSEDTTPAEWPAQYITVYEFDSMQSYESYRDSEDGARLRKDYADRYGTTGKISRQVVVQTNDYSASPAPTE